MQHEGVDDGSLREGQGEIIKHNIARDHRLFKRENCGSLTLPFTMPSETPASVEEEGIAFSNINEALKNEGK